MTDSIQNPVDLKTRRRRADAVCVALLFLLTAAYFQPAWRHGRVFIPADLLLNQYPWGLYHNEIRAAHNPDPSDVIQQQYPWRLFYQKSLRKGEVPLWNPHQFCGAPFAANDQTAVFYPPNLILYRFFDAPLAYTLSAWLHLFMAGFFMFLLLRFERAGPVAAFAGAAVFMFNGCSTAWMAHASKQAAAAWAPLLFLLAAVSLRKNNPRAAWLCVPVVCATLTAGFLQYASYALFALALYLVYVFVTNIRDRDMRISISRFAFVSLLLGILAAAVHLLPVAELAAQSLRPVVVPQHGWFPGLSFRHLLLTLFPDIFGTPMARNLAPGLNYTESIFFISIPAAALCLFSLTRLFRRDESGARGPTIFYFLLALFALAAMLGTPAYALYYYSVPGARSLVVSRIGYLSVFSASVLAGFGVMSLQRVLARWKPVASVAAAMAAFAIVVALLPWSMRFNTFADPRLLFFKTKTTNFLEHERGLFRIWSGDIPWMMFPNTATALGLDDVRGYDSLYPARIRLLLREVQLHWGRTRGTRATTIADAPTVFAAAPLDWMNVRWTLSLDRIRVPGYDESDPGDVRLYRNRRAYPRIFFSGGWAEAEPRAALRRLVAPGYDPMRGIFVEKSMSFPSMSSADEPLRASYRIVQYGAQRIVLDVKTNRNALLFLSNTYDRGWKAELNGEPVEILRANYAFQAVPLSPGGGRLRIYYAPRSAIFGLWISLGVLAAVSAALWRLRKS